MSAEAPEPPTVLTEVASWPPRRVVDVDGWRVGLSGGVTRRASSALALCDVDDLAGTVARVEQVYREDGDPAVFRVGDPENPEGLAAVLDARGYAVASVTDVLVRDLDRHARATPAGPVAGDELRVRGLDVPDEAWLDLWLGGKGGARELSRAIVAGAPARYLTAADADGTDVAVVRAAFVDDWVALSCLQVVPAARRRGVGRALTQHALAVASWHGARRAFLQVEADNVAALRLYGALGFRPAHRYAYRVQPGDDARTRC